MWGVLVGGAEVRMGYWKDSSNRFILTLNRIGRRWEDATDVFVS